MNLHISYIIISLLCLYLPLNLVAESTATNTSSFEKYKTLSAINEPIKPIPKSLSLDEDIVKLGFKLFIDQRLSVDNSISCASCHELENAGIDGKTVSTGVNALKGTRNSPTVYNSSFNFRQFWDGRVRTLEEQIDGPINNLHEMASNWDTILKKLKADKIYLNVFKNIYPKDGITVSNIKHAIATFERSLITPDSPFDLYLNGRIDAIDKQAKRGYELFKLVGCTACHNGVGIGGNLYEKLGVLYPFYIAPYKKEKFDEDVELDFGRYNFTKDESDRFSFKVPSLRNVALTAPYLHDGSVDSLQAVVRLMSLYQLGKKLKPQEVKDIVHFLKTLTGIFPELPDLSNWPSANE